MDDIRFDGFQLGVHVRRRLERRGISEQDIIAVLANPLNVYPGDTPGTVVVEGATALGRLIVVVYSELVDSRGVIAYIVTVYPIRRLRR